MPQSRETQEVFQPERELTVGNLQGGLREYWQKNKNVCHAYAGVIREQNPLLPRCYSTPHPISSNLNLKLYRIPWPTFPHIPQSISLPQGFIFICPAWLTHFFSKYLWSLLFASGPGIGTQWWLKQCCPQEFCSQVCRRDMRRPTVKGRLQWKWVKKEATVNICQNPLTSIFKWESKLQNCKNWL